jgi:POT family proton-dependent oligopeptide transporter
MQNPASRSDGAPGALNLGQSMATRMYCAFYIFYYATPIFFAIMADTRLGRYKTLCICAILYSLGCAVIMLTSFDLAIKAGAGLPGLVIAMILIGLGGGGFKMIMVPFIADQYTETQPRIKVLNSGEQVIADPSLTLQYIYNTYYWVGNVGSLSWFATTFIEKYWSFFGVYFLCFLAMIIATLILFLGGGMYTNVPHDGNVLPETTKIMVCAAKNGFNLLWAEPEYQFEHYGKVVPWSKKLVGELQRGLRACRVLLAFVVFYVCFDQMQNNLISQAKEMETDSIPNDMMPALNQVACILLGPVIQHGLYPFLRRRNINFKPIARITVGFGFVALSMLYATVVQHAIYSSGPCCHAPMSCNPKPGEVEQFYSNGVPNHVSVWIQTPIYFLVAIGEILAYVTSLEYAQDHSPKDMKAIIQAVNLLVAGLGSAIAMALSPIAHDPYLVVFYGCLTAAMLLTTLLFWWLFRSYDLLHDLNADPERNGIHEHRRGFSVLRWPPETPPLVTQPQNDEGVNEDTPPKVTVITKLPPPVTGCRVRSHSTGVTMTKESVASNQHYQLPEAFFALKPPTCGPRCNSMPNPTRYSSSSPVPTLALSAPTPVLQKRERHAHGDVDHIPARGDSVLRIARRFGPTIRDIASTPVIRNNLQENVPPPPPPLSLPR